MPSIETVQRQAFVKRLQELDFRYKDTCDRTLLYVRSKDRQRVYVPRKDWVSVEWARTTLRRCGQSEEEITTFLRQARS